MTDDQIRAMVGQVAANGSTAGAIAEALVSELRALRAERDRLSRVLAGFVPARSRCLAPSDAYDIPCGCCEETAKLSAAALSTPGGQP